MTKTPEIETLTFENAMEELEKIVQKLEAGQDTLEHSISLYERGMVLKKVCEKKLDDAILKIEKVQLDASGTAHGTAETSVS